MNTNDGDNTRGDRLFRWYAHPLTTLIAVMLLALLCALVVGETFAITVLASAVSIITAHSQAYGPDSPTR